MIVLVAPAAPFDAHEQAALHAFVEHGGWLLASVGYEERAGLADLLAHFGMAIEGTPLGGAGSTTVDGDSLTFKKAWPVRAAGATVLAGGRDSPLVVRRAVGRGAVVVIGDPALLLNANLEHEEHAHEQTVAFLRWLFEHHLPPGAATVAGSGADHPGGARADRRVSTTRATDRSSP